MYSDVPWVQIPPSPFFNILVLIVLLAKEDVDSRIMNKKITPEQLFAEKISSAFMPTMETDNAAVIKKLLTKVSETINF